MLSLLLSIVAQTELTPTWGDLVQSLGVSGAVAAILGWQLTLRVRELKDAREKQEETNAKLFELAERAIPALVEATRTLGEVRAAMDATRQSGGNDLDRALRQLERVTEELHRGK